MWQELLDKISRGNLKALARTISLVENEFPGYEQLLQAIPGGGAKIIGITGPPGAGKSTLVDALIGCMVEQGKTVAVLCVDPSSPFNLGAVLGDRIRMSDWYTHPGVFIRSLASRGSMGGLHPKIIEIADLLKAAPFDHIIVETVGVGQSEVEIAGLADTTVVVVVPEAGDEVQTMKAGLMEIADIFVVNKADRPDADMFVRNLRLMLAPSFSKKTDEIPVVKTIAARKEGVDHLYTEMLKKLAKEQLNERNYWLLAEKAWFLIEQKRMRDLDKKKIKEEIAWLSRQGNFNLYQYVSGK
ncbi:MAG: methylmalonyl Co-A mutase-associated GTPase MeaB [Chitinophagaceae bacterium]|nr:methylmalonyl Co-A mutase-associated GTPase MeaB [Chitinophagaceae bacterium]